PLREPFEGVHADCEGSAKALHVRAPELVVENEVLLAFSKPVPVDWFAFAIAHHNTRRGYIDCAETSDFLGRQSLDTRLFQGYQRFRGVASDHHMKAALVSELLQISTKIPEG